MTHGDLAGAAEQSQIIGLASTVQTAAATVTPRQSEWAGVIWAVALSLIAAAGAMVVWKIGVLIRKVLRG